MRRTLSLAVAGVVAALVAAGCGSSSTGSSTNKATAKAGGTMTVALAEDPDLLDPTLARTFVGRIVFGTRSEKLYGFNDKLQIGPERAASLPKFTDGGKTATID